MSDEYVARIKRLLADRGIDTYCFVKGKRHRQVIVARGGKNITITFPNSGSDSRRGPRNCESNLRRALKEAPK